MKFSMHKTIIIVAGAVMAFGLVAPAPVVRAGDGSSQGVINNRRDRNNNDDGDQGNIPNQGEAVGHNRPLPQIPTDAAPDQRALPQTPAGDQRPLPPNPVADDDDAPGSGDGKQKATNDNDWGPQKMAPKLVPALKDANEEPAKNLPPNRPPPGIPAEVKKTNTPAILRDANQSQPQGALVGRNDDTPRTYDRPLVKPFDPYTAPTVKFEGDLRFEGENRDEVRPSSQGTLNGSPIGKFIGGGANSKVYTSSDPRLVKKLVSLQFPGLTPEQVAQTITDQDGGRAILNDILKARPDSPYKVAKQRGRAIVTANGPDGREYRFFMSHEENITSEVKKSDGSTVKGKDGNTAVATNLEERMKYRQEPLSEAEALTLELVIRDLNDYGIIWTDNKAKNLDIVRDDTSQTGYRVVFFDFDGFRAVKGDTRTDRLKAARAIQKVFDDPAIGKAIGADKDRGWKLLNEKLKAVYATHYPKDKGNFRMESAFDFTAFSNQRIGTLATPDANADMGHYLIYNAMTPGTFQKEVQNFNKTTGRNVAFRTADKSPQ
jgi:hypothetical protein